MAERAETLELRTDFSLLIDGEPRQGAEHLDVINPAYGRVFARCPAAGSSELDKAVAAAKRAFGTWRHTSYEQRAALIKELAAALREHQGPLAELLTREQGKPLNQSAAEIDRGAAQSEGMVGIDIPVETLIEDEQRHIELRYRPLGVVGIITPWNAPVNLALGPLVSALYTGNTVVLKPSPYTPLTTLKLGELLNRIFPAGVVNVLAGGDELGQWMTEHVDIDKISFTGSVATGKKVLASAAGTLKRVTLELGGNDPAIILDDADPKAIARKVFFASFVNSGQVCMAIKRIYAHESIYDELCEALVEQANAAVVGNGLDPDTELGPIQNKMQFDKVVDILKDTKQSGARILSGGEVPDEPGYFFPPTLVTDISEDSRLVREEQFGPIVPILKYSELDDALSRANDTRYGLSGSVWTSDPEKGAEIAAKLEVGTAWVNQHRATSAFVPFGGAKESGYGRQYSILGLKGYMEPEVVSVAK
ncbi:aldehyde dehydrogenase family protein [Candidatus Rariloculus sp.]|uniref:aldehyde dehydrogenase family protein n=1 Tax=Candidatus Rariloculus sp. TaxID=3101265 RepID=UPI003D0EA03A